jgi:exopolyphosphatase/guanosine-5'-triphosphate,3'-diphosphate pyrophosphatase
MTSKRAKGKGGHVAVVDIGSNSVRLVVFDGLDRMPLTLFNEKVTCNLGEGLRETGRLSKESMERALASLERFVRMADGIGVSEIHLLATAAAREARNGADFLAEVESRCGHEVKLLSGAEEARLSAQGILSAVPDADGLMGDFGGGSLELVALKGGRPSKLATLPLGLLRLPEPDPPKNRAITKYIDRHLDGLDWIEKLSARRFFAVGGSWRALARVHMAQTDYPLHVVQGYRIRDAANEKVLRVLSRLSPQSASGIGVVPQARLRALPPAALVMRRILRRTQADEVVFSSYGLREGFLFELLRPGRRREDPLLAAVGDLARRERRFGDIGGPLTDWTAPLFGNETAEQTRLRRAVCHLSDLEWRGHPHYRADQAMFRILHHPFVGLDHAGLAFLAYAVFRRYGGERDQPQARAALALLDDDAIERANRIGLALRLAYTLSAGLPNLLGETRVDRDGGCLRLTLPANGAVLHGETVERRLAALMKTLDLSDYRIETG